jgi:hypothetical protein
MVASFYKRTESGSAFVGKYVGEFAGPNQLTIKTKVGWIFVTEFDDKVRVSLCRDGQHGDGSAETEPVNVIFEQEVP